MPQPRKKLSDVNWIKWDEVVEKVRKANTPEAAVERLRRELDFAFKLYQDDRANVLIDDYKRSAFANATMERAEAMAKAMAIKGEDWGEFLDLAVRLDAALAARRKFEL